MGYARGGCSHRRRAARPLGALHRAFGAVHVNVPVHSHLLGTHWRAAEVDPFVDAVELEIERPPIRTERLAVTAPAVRESMRPGADPLFVVHVTKISPARQTRK